VYFSFIFPDFGWAVISGIGGMPANSMPSRVGETTSPLVHRQFVEKLDGFGRGVGAVEHGAASCPENVSNIFHRFPQ
jgi:hypothetical protein